MRTHVLHSRYRPGLFRHRRQSSRADGAALGVGGRACPPEDCGVWSYEELLQALRDPGHERHDELLGWLGGSFDPEAFDLDRTNRVLKEAKAKGYVR